MKNACHDWERELADAAADLDHEPRWESHAEFCDPCGREAAAWKRAAPALVSAAVVRMDPFTERRIRSRILQEGPVARRPASRSKRPWLLAAAAAAVALFAVVLWPTLTRPPEPAGSRTHVSISATAGTRWSREPMGDVERAILADGHLDITVHEDSWRGFVVDVPDGFIEDRGTEFSVTVADGRTTRIDVHSGSVVFHRGADPAILLDAPASWSQPAPEEPVVASAAVPESASSPALVASAPRPHPRPAASTSNAARSPAPQDVDADEDAAYMRIAALLREHRDEEARMAARDYLRRFPSGFRRVEVARVAQ